MEKIELAVILAAGRGSRMLSATEKIPKCLIEVKNVPILHRMLNQLKDIGVKRTIIVVGYLEEKIKDSVGTRWNGMEIDYIVNEKWATTNNVVSLYIAADEIKNHFFLIESDIIISDNALYLMQELNTAAVSKYLPYMDGTVVELDRDGRITAFYLKSDKRRPADPSALYKTVNIYSFDLNDFKNIIVPRLRRLVEEKRNNVYYELAIAEAVTADEIILTAADFSEIKWAEIDDKRDLRRARTIFSG